MADSLEKNMVSNIPKSVLAVGGSLLCLSLSMNLVGVYLGPAINDWMKYKIEAAKMNAACIKEAEFEIESFEKRVILIQKRIQLLEKLSHRKTE